MGDLLSDEEIVAAFKQAAEMGAGEQLMSEEEAWRLLSARECAVPHCEGGSLPPLFVRGDRPCPNYQREAMVNPFDLPPIDFAVQFHGYRIYADPEEAHAVFFGYKVDP